MQSPNRTYLPAIDHLRAFAALLVFYYHSYQLAWYDFVFHRAPGIDDAIRTRNPLVAVLIEGHSAVSLFLVISGFILTYGSLDSPLNTRKFFVNRALRILPLFFAVMLAATWLNAPTDLYLFLQLLSPLGGGLNMGVWTGVAWSISVESQLYLIFPFLHAALRRNDVRTLLKIVALTYMVRLAGIAWGTTMAHITYWQTLGHVEQFVAGATAAWLVRKHPLERWMGFLTPLALGAIVAVLYEFHRLGGFRIEAWWRMFFPTAEALMWTALVVAWLPASQMLPSLISRVIGFIGQISYSIYLLHLPVISLMVNRHWYVHVGEHATLSIIATATVFYLPPILLAAWLTYSLIEKPFLDLRKRYVAPVSNVSESLVSAVSGIS